MLGVQVLLLAPTLILIIGSNMNTDNTLLYLAQNKLMETLSCSYGVPFILVEETIEALINVTVQRIKEELDVVKVNK